MGAASQRGSVNPGCLGYIFALLARSIALLAINLAKLGYFTSRSRTDAVISSERRRAR
jgi:hypothetical protein